MREFRTALIYTTAYLPYIGGAELALKEITERWHNVRVLIVTARLSRTVPQRERIGRAEVIRIGIGIPRVDKLLLAVFGKRFREIFERADAIQAISQYLADWARDMGATAPITVIPNGVDIEKFRFRSWKSDFGGGRSPTSKSIELITTSRLVEKNAVDDIIRALAHLPETVTLEVVGDGVERNNLEVLTHTLNLSSRVHFAGAIAPEEIPLALAHADIFMRPSLSEGLGNSFLEAFAVGLPVIATPVGGIPDFLRDGETGWFAEVRNPESIAACVRYIIDPAHKEHVTHVTAAARALVEKEYSWESVMVRMGAIL